ncbi:MAG: BadF/BadG/BcrA/BcrD ATPase family protein [Bacteroidota bacterium]
MRGRHTLYVGIDAGGSKTLVAVHPTKAQPDADLPATIRYVEGSGINLKQKGMAQALAALHHIVIDALGTPTPDADVVIYAGISGAGRPADQHTLRDGLTSHLAAFNPHVAIVTDADLALLAAHQEQSGILFIVGTGSIVMARTRQGSVVRAGGWGRLIGDEAGGYRIGQAALAAVANAMDGGPATQLVEDLAAAKDISSPDALIDFVYAPQTSLQHIAPLVFATAERGDEVAGQLVHEQLASLTERLEWLYNRHPDIDQRLAFVGGLVKNAWFSKCLTAHVQTRYPDMFFVKPAVSPAQAALQAAMKLI